MKNPILFILLFFAVSCTVSKNYNPAKKYAPEELQEDYRLFRNMLEESHPSLYWYTTKDSLDHYFDLGASKLKDSLTEYKFRNVLSYVLAKIHCGHTSVRASRLASRYAERTRGIQFPLSIKAWDDTVVITSNLSRKDSMVARGSLLTSIDGRPIQTIVDSFFQYLSSDGYNTTHKFQTISNSGVFRSMYGSIYGLKSKTPISYIDTAGVARTTNISLYIPVIDTTRKRRQPENLPSKKERKKLYLQSMRNMKIDTSLNTAFMEVNSFAKSNRLRSFLRSSFKSIRKQGISNLVVDMRGNGGGNVSLSNLLTKYIADQPFKIADSLYATNNKSKYGNHLNNYFLNRLFFIFMTRKTSDGKYHFRYFENRYFKPRKKNNFKGTTYILTGGNTFSAASLFTRALKEQENVVVVGEETGGGAYGNTAWLIPDATLPNTHVRFRLPLFRLVIDPKEQKGRGIIPEVEVKPTVSDIRRNADFKMERVRTLIRERKNIVSAPVNRKF